MTRKVQEVSGYVRYSLIYQIEKMMPRNYEANLIVAENKQSSSIIIKYKNDSILTIGISDNKTNDDVTVSISEDGKVKNMNKLKNEVKEIIIKRLKKY
jgi:hypothetical protein